MAVFVCCSGGQAMSGKKKPWYLAEERQPIHWWEYVAVIAILAAIVVGVMALKGA